ncbi:MAG: acyltransferase [Gammaproteobacteria bacterium]|nr:acyltransferase [Gammaproteobacteria bacterium]
MNSQLYRADIDGLRAIAVICVVLFHYDASLFSGGYIGVDVFFVISGFLITRLIRSELNENRFSLINFYQRRARRLFPALFVTLVICFGFAYQLFSAEHFERFGGTLFYALLSVSNFFFWNEQGYFDTDAVFKPLLHTWSLSVEEQFYLLWPSLMILVCASKLKQYTVFLIAIIGIASLVTCQFMLKSDPQAAFFLTPFRIVEFCIGGLVVWLTDKIRLGRWLKEFLLVTGLLLIGYSVISFNQQTPFPGLTALIPCCGAALVIVAGQAHYTGIILRNQPIVYIGLISYSIYLVHWPLYVFYQYPSAHSLGLQERASLTGLTLILAAIMYELIEKPFRQLRLPGVKLTASGLTLACATLALIAAFPAVHAWKHLGWPWRFSNHTGFQIESDSRKVEMQKRYVYLNINVNCVRKIDKSCYSDATLDGLVIGDSHAVDAYNAMLSATHGRHKLTLFHQSGCDPVLDPEHQIPQRWPTRNKCLKINKHWFNPETYIGYDYLIISSLFGGFFKTRQVKDYIEFIQTQTNIRHIIVFGNYIRLKQKMLSLLEQHESVPKIVEKFTLSAFSENQSLRSMCQKMGCLFIDKQQLFCKNSLTSSCLLISNGIPFTWDKHHLSLEFSTMLGQRAENTINEYLSGLDTKPILVGL